MNYKQDIIDYTQARDLSSLKKVVEKEGIDSIDISNLYRALIISCEKNYEDIVTFILSLYTEKSEDLCIKKNHFLDAITIAIRKGHNDLADILMPLISANQKNLDDFMISACLYNNNYIIDKLIPHCKDILFSNDLLKSAIANSNTKVFKKILPFSNKDLLEDSLFISVIYSREDIVDILFDLCDIVLMKNKIIENKLTGEGVDYFLQKIESLETKEKLEDILQEKIQTTRQKPKIM